MKNRHGDAGTRRRGEKSSRLRVSASARITPGGSGNLAASTSPRPRTDALITLLTDFGTSDYFVGAMKGVILSINPKVRLIDLTHEIPSQDIAGAAFTLLAAYRSFPAGTVHVAVVDPGVGSARRPILAMAGEQYFVGPDNGIFSYQFDREPDAHAFHLTEQSYFHQPVSATFHGRDIFGPVAAALANGVKPEKLGVPINDLVRLAPLQPKRLAKGRFKGRILHVDHFGNCITNFTQDELTSESPGQGVRLTINRKVIKSFKRFFSEEGDGLFAIWGSAGFLEIAAQNRSAAEILKGKRGQPVMVEVNPLQNRER